MKDNLQLYLFILFVITLGIIINITPKQIPLKMVNDLPMIEVTINGIPALLLVDSGANATLLSIDDELKYDFILMEESGIGFNTNSRQRIYSTYKALIKVDGILLTDIEVKAIELHPNRSFDGILGSDYMNRNKMKIDYKKKVLVMGY